MVWTSAKAGAPQGEDLSQGADRLCAPPRGLLSCGLKVAFLGLTAGLSAELVSTWALMLSSARQKGFVGDRALEVRLSPTAWSIAFCWVL